MFDMDCGKVQQIEERTNAWRIASGIAIIGAVVVVGGGVGVAVWYFGTASLTAETVGTGLTVAGMCAKAMGDATGDIDKK